MVRSCASDGTVHALFTCMTVSGGGTSDSTAVQLSTCNGSAGQKRAKGTGGTLVNSGSGKCLAAVGGATADGTRLEIRTCGSGSASQQRSFPA
ncbi:ricin-type beta-trefoil lectin domain protein [Streptomyces pathocidini]|uniref:ricin-type beta-trefoil lectin domain protein n=1 Tax=Streptomyces pathocidini TaxID=1650571 RepID=UPI0033C80A6C